MPPAVKYYNHDRLTKPRSNRRKIRKTERDGEGHTAYNFIFIFVRIFFSFLIKRLSIIFQRDNIAEIADNRTFSKKTAKLIAGRLNRTQEAMSNNHLWLSTSGFLAKRSFHERQREMGQFRAIALPRLFIAHRELAGRCAITESYIMSCNILRRRRDGACDSQKAVLARGEA